MSPLHRRSGAVLICSALLALAACGGDPEPAAAPPGTPAVSAPPPATTPPPSPTPEPASFLSGLPGAPNGPVLFVKVDNTRPAHPQVGLDSADVVYIEQVEGGLTRVAAVFSSRIPARVGPVRSARTTDLELMRQYGEPAFGFSGANARFLPSIARAPVVEVSPDQASSAYRRDRSRNAPYNLFANPGALLAAAPKADKARDVGFRFGPALAGGRTTRTATVRFQGARVGFAWSADRKRWLWSMDGSPARNPSGTQLGASTVVVQYVKLTDSGYRDVNRNQTPHSNTVGTGKALIMRDGKSWQGTWKRPSAGEGTTFSIGSQRATFAPGEVWLVLAPVGRNASLT